MNANGAFLAWFDINNVLDGVRRPMLAMANSNLIDVSKAPNDEGFCIFEEDFLIQAIHNIMTEFH
jgi:hypothetical protein